MRIVSSKMQQYICRVISSMMTAMTDRRGSDKYFNPDQGIKYSGPQQPKAANQETKRQDIITLSVSHIYHNNDIIINA